MARYPRDTYSFSVSIAESINSADAAGNPDTARNADTARSIHPGVAHRLPESHRFTEPNGFAVESLCSPQEHRASCNSQADGEIGDPERGLKADQ